MKQLAIKTATIILLVSASHAVHGSILMVGTETGGNVVFTGGGTANTAGLSLFSNSISVLSGLNASFPAFNSVTTSPVSFYEGVSGPGNFGPGTGGGFTRSSFWSGDILGINNSFGSGLELLLPNNYAGEVLSANLTFANHSFATLGVTPGTHVWTWGSGNDADSFTLVISQQQVIPEPTTALVWACLAGIGMVVLRRHR